MFFSLSIAMRFIAVPLDSIQDCSILTNKFAANLASKRLWIRSLLNFDPPANQRQRGMGGADLQERQRIDAPGSGRSGIVAAVCSCRASTNTATDRRNLQLAVKLIF